MVSNSKNWSSDSSLTKKKKKICDVFNYIDSTAFPHKSSPEQKNLFNSSNDRAKEKHN